MQTNKTSLLDGRCRFSVLPRFLTYCVLKKTGDYLPKRVRGFSLTYADEGGGALVVPLRMRLDATMQPNGG